MKLLLLSLLACTSSVFATGMGSGPGILDEEGTGLSPVQLKCYYHNLSKGCPITLYETHVIFRTDEVDLCSKDADSITRKCKDKNVNSKVTPQIVQKNIVVDPECFTHGTNAQ